MFISLKNIQNLFKEYASIIYGEKNSCCLSCFEILQQDLYRPDPHILYVTDQPDFADRIPFPEGANFLFYCQSNAHVQEIYQQHPTLNLLFVQSSDLKMIHEKISDFFQMSSAVGLFSESLLESLFEETSIQDILDDAHPLFENPVFVFDAGFHLIAGNWDMTEKDPINQVLLSNREFSNHEYELVNQLDHIHDKVLKSKRPILIHHPELDFEQLVCTIDTTKDMGHIVINGTVRPFVEGDKSMLTLLAHAINQQFRKNEFIRNNKGFQFEYFLKDLLDEKIAVDSRSTDSMDYVKKEFHGPFHCIVIETARSSSTVSVPFIRSDFKRNFPDCKTLIYSGEILILLSHPDGKPMKEKDYQKASEICRKHKVFAGISNTFRNIMQLREYYTQALRAIELGASAASSASLKPGLFVYKDYYMDHVLRLFLQKESGETFCHPDMARLLEYDRKYETEFAWSLYMYLSNERNSVLTARKMNVHPNTLRYRLKKIEGMITADLSDMKERQYLILSYEMYKDSGLSLF